MPEEIFDRNFNNKNVLIKNLKGEEMVFHS